MDEQPLATTEQLQARVSFEMSPEDLREAQGAIEDLSDDARHYGSAAWTTPENTPSAVKNLVLRAAARFMRNPEGYIQSRAGDETLAWSDQGENAGTPHFTRAEQEALRKMTGHSGLYTAPVTAWTEVYERRPELTDILVPTPLAPSHIAWARRDEVLHPHPGLSGEGAS